MDNREFDDMLERLSHATFCESGNGGVLHGTVTFGYFMRWGGLTCVQGRAAHRHGTSRIGILTSAKEQGDQRRENGRCDLHQPIGPRRP